MMFEFRGNSGVKHGIWKGNRWAQK